MVVRPFYPNFDVSKFDDFAIYLIIYSLKKGFKISKPDNITSLYLNLTLKISGPLVGVFDIVEPDVVSIHIGVCAQNEGPGSHKIDKISTL